jgi:hypothetical protein
VTFIFIPAGIGERSGYLSTLVLTEVMFLVMLTQLVPISKVVPVIGFLFLAYLALLILMSVFVIWQDSFIIRKKFMLTKKRVVKNEFSIIEFDTESHRILNIRQENNEGSSDGPNNPSLLISNKSNS